MRIKFIPNKSIMRQVKKARDARYCVVVAYANIMNINYREANMHVTRHAHREFRTGVEPYNIDKLFKQNRSYNMQGKTLREFVIENPSGKHFVGIAGHALAVVDGIVRDFYNDPNSKVLQAYKID